MHVLLCLAVALIALAAPQWRVSPSDGNSYGLFQDGVQVGHYNSDTDTYRPMDPATGLFFERCKPPVEPPVRNYGVYLSSDKKATRYLSNGVAVSKDAAVELIENGNAGAGADVDSRHRLVLIGDDKDTRPILNAIGAIKDSDSAFSRYLVQDFQANEWQVAGAGYDCSASPTIYLVAADGKVLWRQSGFDGNVQALEENLRQADPDYNPDADPGPHALIGSNNVADYVFGFSLVFCVVVLAALGLWRSACSRSSQRS